VAQVGIIAKIDYQKAKDALNSAQIRANHASKAAALESDDVGLALKTKINELDRQRLSLANAQRRFDELTVRAPVDGFIGTLNVQNRSMVAANTPLMTLVGDLRRRYGPCCFAWSTPSACCSPNFLCGPPRSGFDARWGPRARRPSSSS
jgi:multidrug resistance efflux pump